MNKYLNFYKKCMEGKMDLTKNYYVLDSDEDFEKNKNTVFFRNIARVRNSAGSVLTPYDKDNESYKRRVRMNAPPPQPTPQL